MRIETVRLALLAFMLLAAELSAVEVVLDVGGFETESINQPPEHWQPFLRSRPSVEVIEHGDRSRKCVLGRRSESDGLTKALKAFLNFYFTIDSMKHR